MRPGEVSLADGGILFLDELPELSGTILEALREPLAHGTITLRRADEATTLPARFRLVAAMTPYPWDEADGARRPTPEQIRALPGPGGEHNRRAPAPRGQDAARAHRGGRGGRRGVRAGAGAHRASAGSTEEAVGRPEPGRRGRSAADGAGPTKGATRLLDTARAKRNLSERRAETVLRVARTVADLARCERVEAEHVAEALGFQRDLLDTSCAEPA